MSNCKQPLEVKRACVYLKWIGGFCCCSHKKEKECPNAGSVAVHNKVIARQVAEGRGRAVTRSQEIENYYRSTP